MPRLTNPSAGTVVTLEGDLEGRYRAAGWVDADASAEQVEVPTEKPKPATRRTRKPRS